MIDRWTPAEVADFFEVPLPTVYGWLRGGHLPAKRQGRLYWISSDDIRAYNPPAGERIRPAAEGESSRAGMVFGAAAVSRFRARNRRALLEREAAAIERSTEPR